MEHFDGTLFSGPLSKLLEQCELIQWKIWKICEPPMIMDHDGCRFNLLEMPKRLLRHLLLDAWRQRIAHEICHREDFAGLVGIQ